MRKNDDELSAPITALLRRTIAEAVESGRTNYIALQRATGVTRTSIMRFVRGTTLYLNKADKLAAFFGLKLRADMKRGKNDANAKDTDS